MKGRTYRYFAGEPLYPFGYGLSYTTFAYRNLALPAEGRRSEDVKLGVEVENTGTVAGEEAVEIYVKRLEGGADAPIRSLAAFQRVSLRPREKRTVQLTIAARHFAGAPATFEISAGGKQPGFSGPTDAVTTSVASARMRM